MKPRVEDVRAGRTDEHKEDERSGDPKESIELGSFIGGSRERMVEWVEGPEYLQEEGVSVKIKELLVVFDLEDVGFGVAAGGSTRS